MGLGQRVRNVRLEGETWRGRKNIEGKRKGE